MNHPNDLLYCVPALCPMKLDCLRHLAWLDHPMAPRIAVEDFSVDMDPVFVCFSMLQAQ